MRVPNNKNCIVGRDLQELFLVVRACRLDIEIVHQIRYLTLTSVRGVFVAIDVESRHPPSTVDSFLGIRGEYTIVHRIRVEFCNLDTIVLFVR